MKKNVLKEDINPITVTKNDTTIKYIPTPEEVAKRLSMHTMKGGPRTPFSTKCASNDKLFHIRTKERTEEQEYNYLRGKMYRNRLKAKNIQSKKDSIRLDKIIKENEKIKTKTESQMRLSKLKLAQTKREELVLIINKMINVDKRTRCADNPGKFREELNAIKAIKQGKLIIGSRKKD